MLRFFLNTLFPPTSLKGREGEWMTPDERRNLTDGPVCLDALSVREHGMPSVHRLAAAARYGASPLLRIAIRRFKYRGIRELKRELGSLLADASSLLPLGADAVLCPVPLHWSREFLRGYNQSRLLAEEVRTRTGCPLQSLLRRVRPTGSQARRERNERGGVLQNAFAVAHSGRALPRHVVLVDDICTSGSTLEACASVLRDAGAERVDALVLAVSF